MGTLSVLVAWGSLLTLGNFLNLLQSTQQQSVVHSKQAASTEPTIIREKDTIDSPLIVFYSSVDSFTVFITSGSVLMVVPSVVLTVV